MSQERPRVRVMAAGVFDLLHTGHLHYLQQAKAMGDELIVVVARDASVRSRKHPPITPEEMRLALVDALKPVDRAILGHEDDHFKTVEELEPDIIALGYDDYHKAEAVADECRRRGLEVEVRRASEYQDDLAGTRRIVRKVLTEDAYRTYLEEDDDDA
ncbi:MAG: adenylyltransferase/cytidyltransferase family protein [Candidatus Thermoplasmatota archaeon]|nr:adenylyltransferase/cytidyltransferase family protein [Candidatus Thermoplasmatota archaeon]